MIFYILFIILIKYIGDELYEEELDLDWYYYSIALTIILGGILYFNY